MQPETPQFDPEKHTKIFRGLSLATGYESDVSYNPNATKYHDGCRICGLEHPSDHTTGMHWSDTKAIASKFAEGFNTEQENPGKLYEGFVDKSDVMSKEEVNKKNISKFSGIAQRIYGNQQISIAELHGINDLAEDPPKYTSEEREVPVRPGSTVYVTKTTDFVPTEKNPRKYHKIIVNHPRPRAMTIKP
jgi:hypothetical protein